MKNEEPPVPPRATGVFLGLWIAILLFLAFVVVPQLFAGCAVAQGGAGS